MLYLLDMLLIELCSLVINYLQTLLETVSCWKEKENCTELGSINNSNSLPSSDSCQLLADSSEVIACVCFAAAAGLLTFSDAICVRHYGKCCCEEYFAISAGNIHYPQHVGENYQQRMVGNVNMQLLFGVCVIVHIYIYCCVFELRHEYLHELHDCIRKQDTERELHKDFHLPKCDIRQPVEVLCFT